MEVIELVFDVEPVAKGRPRIGKFGHAYTPSKTRKAEKEIQDLARVKMAVSHYEMFTGPLTVEMQFILTKPKKPSKEYPSRSDIDNYAKLACDALNEIVWDDDSQIVDLYLTKRWGKKGQIVVRITLLAKDQL